MSLKFKKRPSFNQEEVAEALNDQDNSRQVKNIAFKKTMK